MKKCVFQLKALTKPWSCWMKKQNVSNMSVYIRYCCNPRLYRLIVSCHRDSSSLINKIHMFYPIHYIMFYRSTQFHIKLHSTILYHIISYDIDMISYQITWYHVMSHDVISNHMISHHISRSVVLNILYHSFYHIISKDNVQIDSNNRIHQMTKRMLYVSYQNPNNIFEYTIMSD